MKRLIFFAVFFVYLSGVALAQPQGYAGRIIPVPALPATCNPLNGDVRRLTTGNTGLYICSALNTWTRIDSGQLFNVKAFGAVGDGIADDSAAIQATIAAASLLTGGSNVFFPPGNYLVSKTLTISKDQLIVTSLSQATVIGTAGLGANPVFDLVINPAPALISDVNFMNLSIQTVADGSIGIRATRAHDCYFNNVLINGNGLATNTGTGILIRGLGGTNSSDCRIHQSHIGNYQTGIEFSGGSITNTVDHCHVMGMLPVLAGSTGVTIAAAADAGSSIIASHIHNWALGIADGGTFSQIIGNGFQGNTAAITEGATAVGYYLAANQFDADVTTFTSVIGTKFDGNGYLYMNGLAFGVGLPALRNGTIIYCTDCTIASPCAGGGTGAIAKRLNGAWICN